MRTLIGLVILLLVIIGFVWYVQRDSSFISRLFNRNTTEENAQDEGLTPADQVDSATATPSPESLITCTSELFAQTCIAQLSPVCSVDTTIQADGTETTSRTEYISACHYCKFFGPDNTAEFGDERVTTQGYTVGSCSATQGSSDQKGGN